MRDSDAPVLTPGTSVEPSAEFVLSSFNVLGSKHTGPGKRQAEMASGPARMRLVTDLLAQHEVEVVGFQELEPDQLRAFLQITDGTYGVFPGSSEGGRGAQNSIAWRTDTWELVKAHTIAIPYFGGQRWPMPVALLRNRASGLNAYFSNFHNPATTRLHPDQSHWREVALSREVALVNRLKSDTDYPVFLTGDLNSRADAFCELTGQAAMKAANGGSNDGACKPPLPTHIDWIFGSTDVMFSGYLADQSPSVREASDHPMILARARITGIPLL